MNTGDKEVLRVFCFLLDSRRGLLQTNKTKQIKKQWTPENIHPKTHKRLQKLYYQFYR